MDRATLARASAAAEAIAAPVADGRGSAEYRRKMAGVMTARALARAYARANG
jgi:carbon-monoxide dehydrogenase medium subunit